MVRKKKHPQSRAERLAINELKKARTQEVFAKKRPEPLQSKGIDAVQRTARPKKEVVYEEPRIYVVEEAVGGVADRVPSS